VLPRLPTSFVGRESELALARGLLDRTRLLTLTGPGGCGKTRLAIELASRTSGDFPDGVRFVSLADLLAHRYGLADGGAVLIRPDGHIAWTCTRAVEPIAQLLTALDLTLGRVGDPALAVSA
jgi:hypothetical protein